MGGIGRTYTNDRDVLDAVVKASWLRRRVLLGHLVKKAEFWLVQMTGTNNILAIEIG
jgi:hypothetical protein